MDPLQGPPQPDLLIGQTIGNYLVTQKLGEGGMGSVYLAEHPSIGKKVALKVLHSEFSTDQEVTARFFHEAKAVNDIGHPNIVDIVDFGILQAGPGREQLVYFIMEYLAGLTLSQLIRAESPLPPERALGIALQVADALSASHRCGIIHRDLKPDNIILAQRGRERDFVKLLDFGIAKLTGGGAVGSHRTRTGIVMGTPAYMSPEQCEGRNDKVDWRTDVYALGIVLYEMLTGRVPFQGDGYGEILVQHLTRPPVPLSQIRVLPAHVEVLVLKALEKRADLRYPTMEEFMRAMSDPVGYVEAHGGVGGFLQRQLVPSNAPLPSGRLTPAPLTPLPGTLIAPGLAPGVAPSMPGVRPGSLPPGSLPPGSLRPGSLPPGSLATPSPTTLGAAAGQVQSGRGRTGFIIAGLVIAATAIAAIVVVAQKDGIPNGGGGSAIAANDPGSASGATPGSEAAGGTTPGSATGGTAPGSATGGTTPGSATTGGTPGSATTGGTPGGTTPGSATMGGTAPGTGDLSGSGSAATPGGEAGSAGSGSHRVSTVVDTTTQIGVASSPPGARIYVDGVDTGKITPDKLDVPKKSRSSIAITLKLKGYEPFTFRSVDVAESSQQKAELIRIKTDGGSAPRCRTPERAGCHRDSKGCCVEGAGSGSRNGSGAKTGSAADDPDGLMRP
jgi:serine/threonine-protein kinase